MTTYISNFISQSTTLFSEPRHTQYDDYMKVVGFSNEYLVRLIFNNESSNEFGPTFIQG